MQIEPQVTLPLIYQITDPADLTVYFIRAVVYDSLTKAVLFTKSLVSQGAGLYSSSIYAPADTLGTGKHIHVVITVYTDAGFTTLSDAYQKTVDKYLVKHVGQTFGGGGGSDIDYTRIEKLIAASLKKAIEGIQFPRNDYSLIYERIAAVADQVKTAVGAIKMPTFEQKQQDMSPILAAVSKSTSSIQSALSALPPHPEQKETDLAPVTDAIANLDTELKKITSGALLDAVKAVIVETIKPAIVEAFKANTDWVKKIQALLGEIGTSGHSLPTAPIPEKPAPAAKHPMINRIMPPQA